MNEKILIIIPAYNEEASILKTCKEIYEYNSKYKTNYDILVINDCSTDSTLKICKGNDIPVISLVHNLGIGGAVQTGYKYALSHDYDIAIQFDGDGQHDVNYVEKLIAPIIKDQADFVIGSRFIEELSSFKTSGARRLGIKIISRFIKIACRKKIYDTTSGFRAANKKVITEFANEYPLEYPEPITTVELVKKKYRVEEVAVNMKERVGGKSSIHTWKNVYYMMNVCLSILIAGCRRYR